MNKGNRIVKYTFGTIIFLWLIAAMIMESTIAILPFSIFVIICLIGRKDYISPLLYLIIPWSFSLVMFFSTTIVYTQKSDDLVPIIYIIACILLIVSGFQVGNRISFQGRKKAGHSISGNSVNNAHSAKNITQLVTIMCTLSFIGSIMSIFDLLFMSGINTSSLILMRENYVSREVNIISQISNITSWPSLVVVPALFFLGKKGNILQKIFWGVSLSLYIVQGMLSAGRQIVFSVAIMFIFSFAIKMYLHPKSERKKNKKIKNETKKYRKYIIILSVLAVAYMMFVATSRTNKDLSDTKIGVLQFYFGFQLCDWLEAFVVNLPQGIADGIIEGFVYFTHQLGEFTVFWNIPLIGPFFGLYSIPFIDRRLSFLNLSYSMEEKMTYVRNYMQSQGVMSVGWRTAFSYFIFDFGKVGALIFCFLIGIMAKKIYEKFCRRRTFFSALELTMIVVYLFYTLMMPATCETGLLFMMVFSLVMGAIEKRHPSFSFIIQ